MFDTLQKELLGIIFLITCLGPTIFAFGENPNPRLDSLNRQLQVTNDDAPRQVLLLDILKEVSIEDEKLIQDRLAEFVNIASANGEYQSIADSYVIVGEKFSDNGQIEKSRATYLQLQKIMTELKYTKGIAKSKFLLGSLSLEKGNTETGIDLMNESLEIYNTVSNSSIEMARVQNYLGTFHRDIGSYDQARRWYDQSLDVAQSSEDKNLEASTLNNLGRLYRKKSVYDSAKIYYSSSLKLNLELADKKNIASCYNNLGNIAHVEGDLEEALKNYITSLEIKEQLGFPRGISISYHNIGAVRFDLEDFKLAKKDFEKSLTISKEIDFKHLNIHNYLKLGNIERQLGNVPEAINLHELAYESSEALNFEQGMIEGKAYLGEDYFVAKDFGNALDAYQSCLAMAEKNNRKNYISICLVYIAKCYMGIQELTREGETTSRLSFDQNRNIESLLLRGIEIAQEIDAEENMTASFEALQEYYRNLGAYQKEAQVSRQYIAYRDSLFEKQRVESIAEWSTKYETAEKEKEILLLESERELQEEKAKANRNKFIAGLLILLAIATAGLIYFNLQNKVKRTKQIENLRTKISSDLHDDVGSMLSGLAMQAELLQISMPEADRDKLNRISTMGRSAMSRMRDAVWAMDARKDKFSDLVDRMREFAEETLVQGNISYTLNYSGIEEEKLMLPNVRQSIYLIFKESLTNIIKHAAPSKVVISLVNTKSEFCMRIKNDGVVVDKNYKTTGLGTSNMQMRAENIDGAISFDKSDGFEVILKSPSLS